MEPKDGDSRDYFMGIIEEDVREALIKALRFSADVLEQLEFRRGA